MVKKCNLLMIYSGLELKNAVLMIYTVKICVHLYRYKLNVYINTIKRFKMVIIREKY